MVLLHEAIASEVRTREGCRTLADYDCCQIPKGFLVRSIKLSRREYNRLNKSSILDRPGPQLAPPVPPFVWSKIWEAIPVFGLQAISVAAPADAFRSTKKIDPLVVGKSGGRWYFIAAWDL